MRWFAGARYSGGSPEEGGTVDDLRRTIRVPGHIHQGMFFVHHALVLVASSPQEGTGKISRRPRGPQATGSVAVACLLAAVTHVPAVLRDDNQPVLPDQPRSADAVLNRLPAFVCRQQRWHHRPYLSYQCMELPRPYH